MKAITVPGSVVTKETAPGYLRRVARKLLNPVTQASSIVLTDIERALVNAGFMTWEETEEIEMEVM